MIQILSIVPQLVFQPNPPPLLLPNCLAAQVVFLFAFLILPSRQTVHPFCPLKITMLLCCFTMTIISPCEMLFFL